MSHGAGGVQTFNSSPLTSPYMSALTKFDDGLPVSDGCDFCTACGYVGVCG
jgi:hypothetical protein